MTWIHPVLIPYIIPTLFLLVWSLMVKPEKLQNILFKIPTAILKANYFTTFFKSLSCAFEIFMQGWVYSTTGLECARPDFSPQKIKKKNRTS
jgi:hypothetical protein